MTARESAHGGSAAPLRVLWRDVVDARAVLASRRQTVGSSSDKTHAARADLLSALEAYAAALESVGRPLPYSLRDELRLHRSVAGPWSHRGLPPR